MKKRLQAVIDGASRGNPGHAAIGVLIYDENGELLMKYHRYLGECTNNVAEYQALINCLKTAVQLAASANGLADRGLIITIHSDSELLVKQFHGEYRIKNPQLRELAQQVQHLIEQHELEVDLVHVLRSETREADRLANIALNLHE